MKILVVDDNEDSRLILSALLEGYGHAIETAPNGKLGLECAYKTLPDIIISDILMPEMDGFELCRQIKKNPNLEHINFIFYTATYTEKKDEQLGLSLGASMFIAKPMEPEIFKNKIAGIVESLPKEKASSPQKQIGLDEDNDSHYKHLQTITNKLFKKNLEASVQFEYFKMVAHDLKCPLSIVTGYSGLISEGSNLPMEKIKGFAKKIRDESNKLARMIDNILEFSQIEMSLELALEIKPVNFTELLQKKIELFQDCYTDHQFKLICPPTPLTANIDQLKIEQVIDNLISNAIKYSDPDTLIQVEVKAVNDAVQMSVCDEGIGMAPEHMKKMFEKFYRSPKVSGKSGIGLGAAIAQHIVRQHKGRIWAESTLGKGTTVFIEIPN